MFECWQIVCVVILVLGCGSFLVVVDLSGSFDFSGEKELEQRDEKELKDDEML